MSREAPAAIAIAAVITAYAWFAGGGGFDFPRLKSPDETLYASLAEGFRRGQLHLATEPDARLAALPNPWDEEARHEIPFLWDASYLNGRYYLYFSPLPALIFHLPYRLIRGAYPPDALAGVLFCVWSFLAAVAFTRRALRNDLRVPFAVWVLFIGLGHVAVFLLVEVRTYEVAIMAGSAMTATWAYALLRLLERPVVSRAFWMGLWLALAIAARPNLIVLVAMAAVALLRCTANTRARRTMIAAATLPLAVIALAMLTYNAARFGNPLEFGIAYQLTKVPMQEHAVCGIWSLPELARFANNAMHYVFWPLTIFSEFPFLTPQRAITDPATAFPGLEQVVGIGPIAPLTLIATLLAVILASARRPLDGGGRAGVYAIASAWLILAGLCACWFVVIRYELDFFYLMMAGTAVTVERGLTFLGEFVRELPLRIVVWVLALYSIVAGFILGFAGRDHAFRRLNPELFQRIAEWLS